MWILAPITLRDARASWRVVARAASEDSAAAIHPASGRVTPAEGRARPVLVSAAEYLDRAGGFRAGLREAAPSDGQVSRAALPSVHHPSRLSHFRWRAFIRRPLTIVPDLKLLQTTNANGSRGVMFQAGSRSRVLVAERAGSFAETPPAWPWSCRWGNDCEHAVAAACRCANGRRIRYESSSHGIRLGVRPASVSASRWLPTDSGSSDRSWCSSESCGNDRDGTDPQYNPAARRWPRRVNR